MFLIPTHGDFFRTKQILSTISKAAKYIPRLAAKTTALSIALHLNICTLKLTKINQFSALVTFRHDNFFWLKANSPFCDSRCVLPWSEEHNDVKAQGEGLGDSTGRHANDTCRPLLFARVISRVLQYKYLFARSIAPGYVLNQLPPNSFFNTLLFCRVRIWMNLSRNQ